MKIKQKHLTGRLANFTKSQAQKAFDYARADSDNVDKDDARILEEMQQDGISWAFLWRKTAEGFDYWEALHDGEKTAEPTPAEPTPAEPTPAEFKVKKKHLTGRLANFTKGQVRKALEYAKQNPKNAVRTDEELVEKMQADGIVWAFTWRSTPEGHSYWALMHNGGFHLTNEEIKLIKQLRKLKPSDEMQAGETYYATSNGIEYPLCAYNWANDDTDNGLKQTVGIFRHEKDAAATRKFLKAVRDYVDSNKD